MPLHLSVDPTGRFAYVANASGSNVSCYRIDAATGALSPLAPATVSSGGSMPYFVAVDPTGKFAYAVNWGSFSVSSFTIDADTGALGNLKVLKGTSGDAPRAIAFAK